MSNAQTYYLKEREPRHPDRTYSDRGFEEYGKFTDMYGSEIRVVESSRIDGGVWVFCRNDKVFDDPSPHLNGEQIDKLIALLTTARDRIYAPETPDE